MIFGTPGTNKKRHVEPKLLSIVIGIIIAVGIAVFLLAEYDRGVRDFLRRFITSPEILITVAPILALLVVALYFLVTRPSN